MKKKAVIWIIILVVIAGAIAAGVIINNKKKYEEARHNWDLMRNSIDGSIAWEMYSASAGGKDYKVHALELVNELQHAVISRNNITKTNVSAVDEVIKRLGDDYAWIGFTDEQWGDIRSDIARVARSVNDQVAHLESGGTVNDYDFKFLREEEAEYCAIIIKRINDVSKQ